MILRFKLKICFPEVSSLDRHKLTSVRALTLAFDAMNYLVFQLKVEGIFKAKPSAIEIIMYKDQICVLRLLSLCFMKTM